MAKRRAARRAKRSKTSRKARKAAPNGRSAKRRTAKRSARRASKARPKVKASARKKAPARKTVKKPAAVAKAAVAPVKVPRLDRARRTLQDSETLRTPPSSLDMIRKGTAARSGRAEMEQSRRDYAGMDRGITGGDVDTNVEDAYFTGDEAPGGDNPSPDLEVVDDIGKALGVEYADNEELQGGDEVGKRDKHRWEMDPASSEDYKDRD